MILHPINKYVTVETCIGRNGMSTSQTPKKVWQLIARAIGQKQTFLFYVFVLNSHSTPIILKLQGKQHSNDQELERADYKRNLPGLGS